MTGFVASSIERYAGPVALEVEVDASDTEGVAFVTSRLQLFLQALDAGYFFPGSRRGAEAGVANPRPGMLSARFEVEDLPKTALDVLSGLLLDGVYQEMPSLRSARAVLRNEVKDLFVETLRRPNAVVRPPFDVDVPVDFEAGNNTLLIEIEFLAAVPPDVGEKLLEKLELIEGLWLAYPLADEDGEFEPVESLGAQRHFNDPRTIHHYEFAWDADPVSWNLLVNLCCAWHRTTPIRRLHVE